MGRAGPLCLPMPADDKPHQGTLAGPGAVARSALIVFAVGALFFLAWQLRHVFLLILGAIVVAVVLRALADPFRRRLRLPDWAALLASVLTVAAVIGAAFWLVGSEVAAQVTTLARDLPAAWEQFRERLEGSIAGDVLDQALAELGGSGIVASLGRFGLTLGGAVIGLFVVVVAGIFLAAQPRTYRDGLLQLVPRPQRATAGEAVDASGEALKRWLRGQLVQMLIIGTLTGIGLWIIGVPSALTLGILAGLLEFVPFVGPIIAAIPALLLAGAQGSETFFWTLGLYLVIQQVEGNLVQPLVQRFAVKIPPVVLLFAILFAAPLFGPLGVVLAAPLAVLAFVLVKRLYVREALDTRTRLPGDT
jgi:predicted PurR-regulated permease PerM